MKKKSQTASTKIAAKRKTASVKKAKAGLADSLYIHPDSDPAHSLGHRKMNLKDQFGKKGSKTHPQNDSAKNQMSAAAKIKQTSKTNRRIITGAAMGKTGQITIK